MGTTYLHEISECLILLGLKILKKSVAQKVLLSFFSEKYIFDNAHHGGQSIALFAVFSMQCKRCTRVRVFINDYYVRE